MTTAGQHSTPSKGGEGAAGLDWGAGHYERSPSAAQLVPAARAVIEKAAIGPNQHVVDLGCGPGNAALIAASMGARVTGVDPTQRLLEVARERAADEGIEVTFKSGDAASIPLEDASADAIVSVFAVIFARPGRRGRRDGPRARIGRACRAQRLDPVWRHVRDGLDG